MAKLPPNEGIMIEVYATSRVGQNASVSVAILLALGYNGFMNRQRAGLLAFSVLSLALVLWLPASPLRSAHAQNPDTGYGVNVASERGVQRTAEMGLGWIRIYYPEQLVAAERYGLKVLLLLGWEQPLNDVQSWGDSVFETVSRYRGRVAAYQICNEPNLAEMWHRPTHAEPAEYVTFLREAYQQAKSADPDCIIVSAGLAINGGAGDAAMDDVQFLRGMYAAGARPYFDVLGSHPYGFGYAPEDNWSNPVHCFRRVEQERAVMVQNGDSAKPVWATEVGWIMEPPSHCSGYDGWPGWWWQRVSAQTQADYLVRAFRFSSANWPWMDLMFVWNMDYNLLPWNEYCDPKGWFALLNSDGTQRPAFWSLQALAKGPTDPTARPSPTPSATSTSSPVPAATRTPTPGPTATYPLLPTPTGVAGTGSVQGRVLLQGRSHHLGILVMIGGQNIQTGDDGAFVVFGVPAGTQELLTHMSSYLRGAEFGVEVRSGQVTFLPDILLRGGDINADDNVNLFDLVAVGSHYGTQGPAQPEDVNGDSEVNVFDLVLVGINYGASAAMQ
jgi:hypothetical protein